MKIFFTLYEIIFLLFIKVLMLQNHLQYFFSSTGWWQRLSRRPRISIRRPLFNSLWRCPRSPRRASSPRVGWDVSAYEGSRRPWDSTNTTFSQPRVPGAKQPHNFAFTANLRTWKIFGELVFVVINLHIIHVKVCVKMVVYFFVIPWCRNISNALDYVCNGDKIYRTGSFLPTSASTII